MTIERLYATIFHMLFDVGQLRITQGISQDVLKIATAAEPIPGLTLEAEGTVPWLICSEGARHRGWSRVD